MLEAPQALLDERRAKGLDESDEMWEGELYIRAETVDGKLCLTRDGGSAEI